ncbi:multidrug resistance-associated protein 1-like [Stegodyphus dumicola]|uniref:multidrug resistance-associated protein 1-like n=1 Tax=Stegodyphus dumicola TaxID=202533 RepID=UPI0015AD3DB1|nr:multidrug resistance-associated protein 1-like [Stegodyphus dumicola]
MESNQVKLAVYLNYVRKCTVYLFLLAVIFYGAYQGFEIAAKYALTSWSSEDIISLNSSVINYTDLGQDRLNNSISHDDILRYMSFGIVQGICVIIGNSLLAVTCTRASRIFHRSLIDSVIKAPMSFFDTTPHGRLINRFARDINTIDSDMPYSIDYVLACLFVVLGTFCVITVNIPKFILFMIPFIIGYFFLQNLYLNASQKLKRLECVSRSPIFSDFEESIQGITSIRSYDMDETLMDIFGDKVDENSTCSYHWYMCSRWLSVCIDSISVIIILTTVLISLNDINELTTSDIGLSLVYALTVTDSFTWLIRTCTDFQNQIISVERVEEYSVLPSEAAWVVTNEEIPENWPEEGRIAFHEFSACYRQGLDLALNNLNFEIAARQKVGIVGRTGAGKSSLTLALFRIIEAATGYITIDGIDISTIGLHTLRSKLTIIPQDPVLFTGSVRSNLDPNKEYNDDDVWICLERAHLKDYITSLPEGLEFQIAEGGVNLSLGQRQLVCLARSLLKRTKILVLDEPTAAVDPETDHMIQETIRAEFQDCTVITIAHRLNTVMDYDISIVMESGKVIEQGNPKDLMKNQNSVFYSMTRDAALM